jgi:hypothetical protein
MNRIAGYSLVKRRAQNSAGRKFTLKLTPIPGVVRRATLILRTDDAELAHEARVARLQKLIDEVNAEEQ